MSFSRAVSPETNLLFSCFDDWKGILLLASVLGTGMRNDCGSLMILKQISTYSLYLQEAWPPYPKHLECNFSREYMSSTCWGWAGRENHPAACVRRRRSKVSFPLQIINPHLSFRFKTQSTSHVLDLSKVNWVLSLFLCEGTQALAFSASLSKKYVLKYGTTISFSNSWRKRSKLRF